MNEPQELDIQLGGKRSAGPDAVRPSRRRKHGGYAAAAGEPRKLPTRAYFSEEALREILAHAATSPHAEVGGVLLGTVTFWRRTVRLRVEQTLPARTAGERRAELTFTHETWAQLNEEQSRVCPDLQIIGWYHTHPGLGVFMSDRDVFIHNNFFAHEGFLALVVDPVSGNRGLFHWADYVVRPMTGYYVYGPRSRRRNIEALANPFGRPARKRLRLRTVLPWLIVLALILALAGTYRTICITDSSGWHAAFGAAFSARGQYTEAHWEYRRARILKSTNGAVYKSEATALGQISDFAKEGDRVKFQTEATAILRDASKQAPKSVEIVRNALLEAATNAPTDYLKSLTKALEVAVPKPKPPPTTGATP